MTSRLSRKNAMTMEELVQEYIRNMKIASGLNEQRIYAAWDAVSGAAKWTISRYCRNGILYCSISSSVVRSRLFLDRKDILEKINAFLRDDGLFVKDDPGTGFLRDIVLK